MPLLHWFHPKTHISITSHARIRINTTSHMRIRISTTSYVTILISTTSYMRNRIRCCNSHENPYQVLQLTCAASERGMKSMLCMRHFPLWLTCKVASPIDTHSSAYSNFLQLHVKFQYLFFHPVKG